MFVVSGDGAADPAAPPSPEFGLAGAKEIRLPPRWQNPESARHLASRVARKPGDLTSHMRRLWLHRDMGDSAGVTAAAIDLFIATQDKGHDLRVRVLRAFARELRESGCYEVLQSSLEHGLSRHEPRIACAESVLCRPIQGSFDYVRRVPDSDAAIALAAEAFDWSLDAAEPSPP